MAKTASTGNTHTKLHKRTKQGGRVKRASMSKAEKRSFKPNRGQGR